jgi:hypothetical protein
MIVRACDFALVLLRDEKDLVRGFSSRAMRRVRVTTPASPAPPLSRFAGCVVPLAGRPAFCNRVDINSV